MKKLVSLFIALVLGVALGGCSEEGEPFSAKTFIQGDEKITAVRVDARDRSVEVKASKDGKVRVEYFENSKEFYEVSVSAEGIFTMAAADDKEIEDYIGKNAPAEFRRITLWVPQETLRSLEISTTNEDISLEEISLAERVSLYSNGGDVLFKSLNAGKEISLEAKNGNISGVVSGSYDDYAISCTIKKGDTDLPETKDGGDKTLTVNANNGDVNIEFVK